MKSLYQSLVDYELALLQAIAECRAVPLSTSNQAEVVTQLANALLSPADTAIVIDDLSPEETGALRFLIGHGGAVEVGRFTRQYGQIRPMGPARLARERPWQNPDNPAEKLWYRGLIFKAFQVIEQGSQEVVYIPLDLLPLIKPKLGQTGSDQSLAVARVDPPAQRWHDEDRLRENFFNLLVYLQTHPTRLQSQNKLAAKSKEALLDCLLPAPFPAFSTSTELDFLLHLGQRAGLLTIAHGRLKPSPDPVRDWLQADVHAQLHLLQRTWRADPTWNDLWHVPQLAPQPTGWENSPLRARSKILGYLEQLDSSEAAWFSINSFIAAIKQTDPDFQRPNGDYASWYIQDAQGNSLMGFEHWDQVEGALIRYFITNILLLLGAVALGTSSGKDSPSSFRLTKLGRAFLAGQSLPEDSPTKPAFLRVNDKFQVRVPAQASLYDRFQLARFATLEQHESSKIIYRITRSGLNRALRNGVTAEQIIAFLTRATNNQTPLKVVEMLRAWGARYGTVKLEQATLLHVQAERQLAEMRQHPGLRELLGDVIGPTTVLVPGNNVAKVRKLLVELGYLEAE